MSIYSKNRYQSYDLDFVESVPVGRKKLKEALTELGFVEKNRYFKHSATEFFLEFPTGPLSVGSESVKATIVMEFSTGNLVMLSPTDCVKDRLAAYYHWNDRQALAQALLVAKDNDINVEEIRRWSEKEDKLTEFESIRKQLSKAQHHC